MNMRSCLRWLLLACVCLCVLCSNSHIVYAASTANEDIYSTDLDNNINITDFDEDDYVNGNIEAFQQFGVNGRFDYVAISKPFINLEGANGSITDLNVKHYSPSMGVSDKISISTSLYTKMFSKGSSLEWNFSGIHNSVYVYNGSSLVKKCYFNGEISSLYVQFYDSKGSYTEKRITDYDITSHGDGRYSININIDEVPVDTYTITFTILYSMSDYEGYSSVYSSDSSYVFDRNGGFAESVLNFNEKPHNETNSLLGGVIQWLTSIRDNIVNLPSVVINGVKGFFDNVVKSISSMADNITSKLQSVLDGIQNKLQSVLDGITNALSSLGNFIIDGIKGLFVPSDDVLTSFQDRWTDLLASRFGALYEVVDLVIQYANSFNNASIVACDSDGGKCITIPRIVVALAGAEFVFGGWDVPIVPSGFEFLFDSLKLIVSISATILFVNGLKNKFERLVSR